jgi:hypothetical protein
MPTLITTKKQLKELDSNQYNNSSFVFDDSGNIYSVEEFLKFENSHVYNDYDNQNYYYAIHWEGEPLNTENGEVIQPAY